MRVAQTKPLFAWDCLDDSPTLKTIRQLLAAVPDGRLLDSLKTARGKGRDDYAITSLWGVLLLTVALRHPTTEACLAELRRNASLRRLIGLGSEEGVPRKWNMSRFLDTLGRQPHLALLHEVFNVMARRLAEVVPDLGRETAGDATSLNARRKKEQAAGNEKADGLPQPAGGRKEYTDQDGKVTKVVEWFGYKLHLLVDVNHEVSLAYQGTSTKAGDGETLPAVLTEAKANLPKHRIKTLAYDKAADPRDVHRVLHKAKIKPLIQNRSLWNEEPERMLPGHDGSSNVVYNEAGTLYCYDRVSQPMVRHPMAYIGHEPQRQTLKYRCPAMHEGWPCPMSSICSSSTTAGLAIWCAARCGSVCAPFGRTRGACASSVSAMRRRT